jgi:DNA-binding transcriptional ArsR family regulator
MAAPLPQGSEQGGEVFAALADPTRRHLVETLASRGGASATALAAELPISRQAVTKHLATLGGAGLVRSRRDGRETVYELQPAPLAEAATWIAGVGAEWEHRLARLQRLLGK